MSEFRPYRVVYRSTVTFETDLPRKSKDIDSPGVLHAVRSAAPSPQTSDDINGEEHVFTWIENSAHIEKALNHLEGREFDLRNDVVFIPYSSKRNWLDRYPHAAPAFQVRLSQNRSGQSCPVFEGLESKEIGRETDTATKNAPTDREKNERHHLMMSDKPNTPPNNKYIGDDERDLLHMEIYNYFLWLYAKLADPGESVPGKEGSKLIHSPEKSTEVSRLNKRVDVKELQDVLDKLELAFPIIRSTCNEAQPGGNELGAIDGGNGTREEDLEAWRGEGVKEFRAWAAKTRQKASRRAAGGRGAGDRAAGLVERPGPMRHPEEPCGRLLAYRERGGVIGGDGDGASVDPSRWCEAELLRAEGAMRTRGVKSLDLAALAVSRGRLGIALQFPREALAVVAGVDPTCTFGDKVAVGDRLISVDGASVTRAEDLEAWKAGGKEFRVLSMLKSRPDGRAKLSLDRNQQKKKSHLVVSRKGTPFLEKALGDALIRLVNSEKSAEAADGPQEKRARSCSEPSITDRSVGDFTKREHSDCFSAAPNETIEESSEKESSEIGGVLKHPDEQSVRAPARLDLGDLKGPGKLTTRAMYLLWHCGDKSRHIPPAKLWDKDDSHAFFTREKAMFDATQVMKFIDNAAWENGMSPKAEGMTRDEANSCFDAAKSGLALLLKTHGGCRSTDLEHLAWHTFSILLPKRKRQSVTMPITKRQSVTEQAETGAEEVKEAGGKSEVPEGDELIPEHLVGGSGTLKVRGKLNIRAMYLLWHCGDESQKITPAKFWDHVGFRAISSRRSTIYEVRKVIKAINDAASKNGVPPAEVMTHNEANSCFDAAKPGLENSLEPPNGSWRDLEKVSWHTFVNWLRRKKRQSVTHQTETDVEEFKEDGGEADMTERNGVIPGNMKVGQQTESDAESAETADGPRKKRARSCSESSITDHSAGDFTKIELGDCFSAAQNETIEQSSEKESSEISGVLEHPDQQSVQAPARLDLGDL